MRHVGVGAFISLIVLAAVPVSGASVGPSPYLKAADSPFAGGTYSYFHLEDFEDGLLNTPGVTSVGGVVIGPTSNTDSVDADDGSIDGSGLQGHSYFGNGTTGITFTFNALALGTLPTDVGLVWTDGATSNTIRFEAFDAGGSSLGVTSLSPHGDSNFLGGTAEDRFFGWTHAGGISRIHMRSIPLPGAQGAGIEVDHLQYGATVVPLPAAVWPGLALLAAVGIRRLTRPAR